MDKISRWIVTITIIETWTITWADGEERTVIYRSRQSFQTLPACPNDPQGGNDLEPIATYSSQCSAIVQVEASFTVRTYHLPQVPVRIPVRVN
jgi:hypothetical protein